MNVIRIDRRTAQIAVPRAALRPLLAEDALAANQSARDAVAAAEQAVWAGNRAAVLHALARIGFEVGERTAALMALTQMAEQATACPDGVAAPSHGAAA